MKQKKSSDDITIRKFAIIAVIAIIVLFFIIFYGAKWYFEQKSQYPTVEYNGFTFTNISNTWYTEWQYKNKLVTIALRYNPYQVQNVSVKGLLSKKFTNKQVYITFDPLSEDDAFKYLALAGAELGESLAKVFEKDIYASCTKNETDACIDRPIVTCDSTDYPVIFMKAEGPTQILFEDNCVTLQGEGFELLRAANKFLYIWYKIIPVKLVVKNQTIENQTITNQTDG